MLSSHSLLWRDAKAANCPLPTFSPIETVDTARIIMHTSPYLQTIASVNR
ncbi:MAG TPA: hypothetical protein PK140_16940 [Polyangiaceae bacterium]|nr:hypothetical protein [Polyangiaceae bacterium]